MSHTLIVLDGVMRKLVGGAPIPEGLRLYLSLAATGQIILLSDAPGQAQEWLELHGCTRHAFIRITDPSFTVADQANALRREGYDLGMVVVADPEQATGLIGAGFNTVLFTHARYAQPSWRPDTPTGVKPWGDIVDLVTHQAKMKAADERLKTDD